MVRAAADSVSEPMTTPRTDTSRTVLITGAARRLGRALALDFARAGWRVGVHYATSAADAETVVSAITDAGGSARAFKAARTSIPSYRATAAAERHRTLA